jgi:hypothetical protein
MVPLEFLFNYAHEFSFSSILKQISASLIFHEKIFSSHFLHLDFLFQ